MSYQDACFRPDAAQTGQAELHNFIRICARRTGQTFATYADFEAFAIREFRTFWRLFLETYAIATTGDAEPVCDGDVIERAQFFPNLRLNYAERLLRGADAGIALITYNEANQPASVSRAALRERVQRVAGGLRRLGVNPLDRAVAIVCRW